MRNIVSTKISNGLIGLIPAAGRGTRMRPITKTLPKALIEIQGQSLLERAIEMLKALGVEKIIIVTGYLEEKVRHFLCTRDFGVQIELISQKEQLGFAHAVGVSASHLTDDFVILCPDSLYTNPDDFQQAKQIFCKYRPTVLQATTVTPHRQRNRSVYFSGSLRKLAGNLFDNGPGSSGFKGLPMHSTGLTFFSKDAVNYLPSFKDFREEYEFPGFLSTIMANSSFMIYLMRGTRHDFTEPKDIDFYANLQESLSNTVGEGVSAILINSKTGKVLLHLRDNIPMIRYPAHWALFGGNIEPGETPYEAIKREVKEELNYEFVNFGLFREFVQNNKREFAFVGEINAELRDLTLNEGQDMRFFEPPKISTLKIRPDDRKTLEIYFNGYFRE